MTWQSNPYTIPLIIAVIVVAAWAIMSWARHSNWLPGKLSILLTLAAAAWTLIDALELASADPIWKLFLFRTTILIAVWLSALWFVLALSLTGRMKWLKNRRWILLVLFPLFTSLLTLVDDRYHLIVANVKYVRLGQTLYLSYDYGTLLTAFALYANLLQLVSAVFFSQVGLRSRQFHWRQIAVILAGWSTTLGFFLFDITNQHPVIQPRLLPLSILIAFPIVVAIFNRVRRADFSPIVRGSLIDKLPDPMILLDASGIVLDLNPAAEMVFKSSLAEVIGHSIVQLDANMVGIAETFSAVDNPNLTLEFTKDQRVFDVRGTILTDWRQRVVCRALVLRDITERKQMEQDLLLTQFCVDQASIGIMRTGRDAKILSVNQQWCQALGYSAQELSSMHVYDLDPNFPLERWKEHRTQLRHQVSDTFETVHQRKDGSTFPVEITANYLSFQKDEFSISFIRDITERKLASENISASLREKEILLKEIHHRVKNNLQIISSLLNLQSNAIDDPLVLAQFQDSQNRVRSMALIHERLYRSDDLARIDFGTYLRDLAESLVQTYRRQAQSVSLKVEVDTVMLDIDTAIPCGLIVNELVSNALKHGFPNGRAGQIGVEIRQAGEDGQYRLVIWDDGVGMPEGVDTRNTPSLGLQLVNSLTGQIGGGFELCREGGTKFDIRFSGLGASRQERAG